jgi:MerR family transcriptional regulator/heat shock protein HspR
MAKRTTKEHGRRTYMISAVAKRYSLHPQTLRLYERDGLLAPSRTEGNTRVYTDEDLERLEIILNLTRTLGVNLAGVEVVLNMREKMAHMQREMNEFLTYFVKEMRSAGVTREEIREKAIVRVSSGAMQVLLDRLEEDDGSEG